MSEVRVRFPMSQEIWNKVVVETREDIVVEEESTTDFVVEYETEHDFQSALNRFEGMIEYQRLTDT